MLLLLRVLLLPVAMRFEHVPGARHNRAQQSAHVAQINGLVVQVPQVLHESIYCLRRSEATMSSTATCSNPRVQYHLI